MYNINRNDAAEILAISTRSIDRYIKAWKIRAKKVWKMVMLNEEDIRLLKWDSPVKQKIIVWEKVSTKTDSSQANIDQSRTWGIIRKAEYEKVLATFEKMYSSFRDEIKQKDEKIQELSLELWKAQEQKNNTIDLMEYKKVQFLSEETKSSLSKEIDKQKEENINMQKELSYEKSTNKMLIVFIVILFILAIVLFFINI